MPTAIITKTSADSAVVEPFVLRESTTTRLVFKPQIVNNKADQTKPVKGELLWQRRKPSEQGDEWADETHVKLSEIKAGSGVKLELKTDELYLLTQVVRGLYGVFWKNGNRLPATGTEFDLPEYARAARTLDTLESAAELIEVLGEEGFVGLLKLLAKQENAGEVIQALAKLNVTDLTEINSLAGVGLLKQALHTWEANAGNADEDFWQETLSKYSFVFSQVFSSPVVVFKEKAYVGGKSLEAQGGTETDFLLKNELTDHVLIVEIKTPETELLGKSPYRPPNVFAVSRDVAGAVAQTARYKDEFLKHFGLLAAEEGERFRLADPRCLIVVGKLDQLDTNPKRDSFEHFARGLRGTEIITFDELFRKVEVLLDLLQGSPHPPTPGPTKG